MKIAITYDNGNVFQHFGRTEEFKVYNVEDQKVVSSELIGSNGSGHGALAGLLADHQIDVLICGGIGAGAQNALAEAGIELCSGASGDVDLAVEAYLKGELVNAGSTCDHHDHGEGHSCGGHDGEHHCGHHDHADGHHCEHHQEEAATAESKEEEMPQEEEASCGGNCGGCAGGCGGGIQISLEGPNAGKLCKVHYRGTFNDGSQFDSSYDRGEPIEFICGAGQMIAGFDKAVVDMEIGQIVDIHLMPEEAYGMPDPSAIIEVEIANLPGSEALNLGDRVYLTNAWGQQFPVTVIAKDEKNITFDANHEMAGKELNFRIELVSAVEYM